MNNDPIPPAGSLGALLEALSSKDDWAKRLMEHEAAQKKAVDLIKELEKKQQEFSDQVAAHNANSATVSAALAKDMRSLEQGKAELAARENGLAAKIVDHEKALNAANAAASARHDALSVREATVNDREAAIAAKEADVKAHLDAAESARKDIERRLSIIKSAQS